MKWISVKDRLPEEDEKVWVFRRGREEPDGFDDEIVLLIYDGSNEFRSMDFASVENINDICTIDMRQITHWKPFREIETPS